MEEDEEEDRTDLPPLQQPNSLQRKMLEMAGQVCEVWRIRSDLNLFELLDRIRPHDSELRYTM